MYPRCTGCIQSEVGFTDTAETYSPCWRHQPPRWQLAPKDWVPGPIRPCSSTAFIGGCEAKTTRERVVPGGWVIVLPVYGQPINDLLGDTRLHHLLVGLLDI